MQPGAPYKKCPRCGQSTELAAVQCVQCGHQYSTQFAPPPNQTQAFYAGDQGVGYPRTPPPLYGNPNFNLPNNSVNSFSQFLLGIPHVVCFIIGFLLHLPAIIMLVFYFGVDPKDHSRGWAVAWGLIVSALIGFAFMALFLALGSATHR